MQKSIFLLVCLVFFSFSFISDKKSIRKFEKKLALVQPNLYACKYEVSNLDYREFLNDLDQNGKKEDHEIARIHNENWRDITGDNEPFIKTYHQHPAYNNYPVVNISHESAKLYCDWLTKKYHENEFRSFKSVKFRLPTKEEWITAARAGHEMAPFPWEGYYLRNSEGKFLANFYRIPQTALKAKHTKEGIEVVFDEKAMLPQRFSQVTAPVESYIPNDFGLLNMSGNVTEMLAEAGTTKGGSWLSSAYYLQIGADDEFAGWEKPSPMIGFRFFMEVIEE